MNHDCLRTQQAKAQQVSKEAKAKAAAAGGSKSKKVCHLCVFPEGFTKVSGGGWGAACC